MSVFTYLVNDSNKKVIFLGGSKEWSNIFSQSNTPVTTENLFKVHAMPERPDMERIMSVIDGNSVRIVTDSFDSYYQLMRKTVQINNSEIGSEDFKSTESHNRYVVRTVKEHYTEV